jgi:hypothetical protein
MGRRFFVNEGPRLKGKVKPPIVVLPFPTIFSQKIILKKKLQLTLKRKNGLITGANFPQQEE